MILLVNGPNLNLLGEREPEVYGRETLADVERMVRDACAGYGRDVLAFQSNHEGAILDFLQEHRRAAEGVIVNPGALTHTSRALHDCLKALPCPAVEVHVSNIHAREAWRRESVVAPAALGQITGLGVAGYRYAAVHLCERLATVAAGEGAAAQPARGAAPLRRAEPSLGAEHGCTERDATGAAWPRQPGKGGGEHTSVLPGEDIPVDVNSRGEYEPH
jgi:3-dehydroquinate dehydratase II